jgi:hypothetical protein
VSLGASRYLDGAVLAVATDSSGALYLAGSTGLAGAATPGAFQAALAGSTDVFVAKLAPDASLVWATYLGGSDAELARGIAVDAAGDVHLTGTTFSPDFPTTPDGFQPTCAGPAGPGCASAFVSKLRGDGGALLWSTFLKGGANPTTADFPEGSGLALVQGLTCAVGQTSSQSFPVTADAPQPAFGGGTDAFVTCLDTARSGAAALAFSTYLGGPGLESASGIAGDAAGNLYVSGQGDGALAFALTPARTLRYATRLSGTNGAVALGVATGGDGTAVLVGFTRSPDFPTLGAIQPDIGGGPAWGATMGDAFVAKLDPTGQVTFSTFLGGLEQDAARGVAVGADGDIHVCGSTWAVDFPVRSGAVDTTTFNQTAFAVGLSADGATVRYATTYRTMVEALACSLASDLVVAGLGSSQRVQLGAPQGRPSGGVDGFVARLGLGAPAVADLGLVRPTLSSARHGRLVLDLEVANRGPAAASGVFLRGVSSAPGAFGVAGRACFNLLSGWGACELGAVTAGTTGLAVDLSSLEPGPIDFLLWTVAHQADVAGADDALLVHAFVPGSHLRPRLSLTPPRPAQGEEARLAARVDNGGPDRADDVEVRLAFGGGWVPGGAGLPAGCLADPPFLRCPLGSVAAGGTGTLELPLRLTSAGSQFVAADFSSLSLDRQVESARLDLEVAAADVSLQATPAAITVEAGQAATFDLELRATSGAFHAPFQVSCRASIPQGTCTAAPQSLAPGVGPARGVLTVATTARNASAGTLRAPPPGAILAGALLLVLLALAGLRPTAGPVRARVAACGLSGMLLAGCPPSSPPGPPPVVPPAGGTPAGTYQITVEALLDGTSGPTAVLRTTQVHLVVR